MYMCVCVLPSLKINQKFRRETANLWEVFYENVYDANANLEYTHKETDRFIWLMPISNGGFACFSSSFFFEDYYHLLGSTVEIWMFIMQQFMLRIVDCGTISMETKLVHFKYLRPFSSSCRWNRTWMLKSYIFVCLFVDCLQFDKWNAHKV